MWAAVTIMALAACQSKREQKKPTQPRVSIQEIETGIRAYIDQKSRESGGYFQVADRGQDFRMKLVRVHTEYLSNLGPNKHFACVDLVDVSGDVYDVDFFLTGPPGAMEVTETTVHKLNGKPFYAWKQRPDKTWHRVGVKEASTRLLGVVEGNDTFDFSYTVQLPKISEPASIWIPIAQTDAHQIISIKSMNVPGTYQILKDRDYQNSVLYATLHPSDSEQQIEIRYTVQRAERSPQPAVEPPQARDLQPNLTMPVGGRFEEIALEAVKFNTTDLMKARSLYDYVIDNMRYMKYGKFGQGDANHACDVRTGNCTEFHSFFISLARSIQIPARFAVGASIPSERNEGGIDGYHCWAEFYTDGKWWPVDISEGNKYSALATYYFGHHPANRIEFSRGRDLVLTPGPASGPINFLAYPVFEMGGKREDVRTTFSFVRAEAFTQN
jgi:transglutaminase-like putative cysteine protease